MIASEMCACLSAGGGPFDPRRLRTLRALLEQHIFLSIQLFCIFSQDEKCAGHFASVSGALRILWLRAGAPEREVRRVVQLYIYKIII